jgi:DNA-binding NtrC family response regulator
VRRAVLFSRDGVVRPDSFSPDLKAEIQRVRSSQAKQASSGLAVEVAQTEQGIIEQMLRAQKFNRAATARALGISRVTLYNKIRKYNIHLD